MIENYLKELDDVCEKYLKIKDDEEKIKLVKIIITLIDDVSRDMSMRDEATVIKIVNHLYIVSITNKEIQLKCCELALKMQNLTGNEKIYIDTLLKSIQYLNDQIILTIIQSDYFLEYYQFISPVLINHCLKHQKYKLLHHILKDIEDLRSLNHKEILIHFVLESTSYLKTLDNENQPVELVGFIKAVNRFDKTKTNTTSTSGNNGNWYISVFAVFIIGIGVILYFYGEEVAQFFNLNM